MDRKGYIFLVISLIFFIISAVFIADTSARYGNVCKSYDFGISPDSESDYTFKTILIVLVIGVLAFIISSVILRFVDITNKQKALVILVYIALFVGFCIYTSKTSYETAYDSMMSSALGNKCGVELMGDPLIKYIYGFILVIWGGGYLLIKKKS